MKRTTKRIAQELIAKARELKRQTGRTTKEILDAALQYVMRLGHGR